MSNSVVRMLKQQEAIALLASFYDFALKSGIVPDLQEQPHREMCAEIAEMEPGFGVRRKQIKKLFLSPRFTYKSSLIIAFIVYLLCKYPNIRILLYRATRELAEAMLSEVKLILETNPTIRYAFGDLSKNAEPWARSQITIATRTKPDKDPSVATAGLEVSTTGTHPDIIFGDDIVVYENCDSLTEMARAWGLVQSWYALLPDHGSLLISGTRWSNIDAYSRIIEANQKQREANEEQSYKEYIRQIYYTDANGEQQLFFPARLHEDFIAQQRRDLEPRWFYAWYYNQPYETGLKPFTNLQFFSAEYHHGFFNYIELDRKEYQEYRIPLTVGFAMDCALTDKASSDRFGFVAGGIDSTLTRWILEAHEWNKLPSDITDEIETLLIRYHPEFFIIESANADVKMVSRIANIIRDLELETIILSYSALQDEARGRRGKSQRIGAMEPINRKGLLRLRKAWTAPLTRQLDLYPGVTKDDVIDSLAMLEKGFDTVPKPASTYEEAVRHPVDDGWEREDSWREAILNPPEIPPWAQIYIPGQDQRDNGKGSWTGPRILRP